MKKDYDIVALGELLIDFTDVGKSAGGMKLFEQNPGGAPANLLTVASNMGYHTAFIGKVGKDMHGAFLKKTLQNVGIDTGAVIEDEDYFTTLAFVEINENGERNFSFSRKPGADTMLSPEELDHKLLKSCRIFHFGSLSLTAEPSKSATLHAVSVAKQAGALISYDPNYRPSLWKNREDAIMMMKSVVPQVDVMKVSDEESLLLTGETDYTKASEVLLSMGVKLVAVTLGADGVLVADRGHQEIIPAFQAEAVDTTGAGDSFWGGFLSHLLSLQALEQTSGGGIKIPEWEKLRQCAVWGNATAALCVQKRGGIPAIPKREAVTRFLKMRFEGIEAV